MNTATSTTTSTIAQETLKEVITDNQTDAETEEEVITSPLRAIRMKCLDCCCGQISEVRNCPCTNCSLHPFRMGNNPYRKREMTEEQKQAARDRLTKARTKIGKG